MAMKKSKQSATVKSSVKRRSVNAGASIQPAGKMPGQEQDTQRRLGQFEGTGEPPRKGARTAGIVGQTTKRSRTDKKSR
jgi:hypothetical protein